MEKVWITVEMDKSRKYSIEIYDVLRAPDTGHFRSFKDLVGYKIVGIEEVEDGFILSLE